VGAATMTLILNLTQGLSHHPHVQAGSRARPIYDVALPAIVVRGSEEMAAQRRFGAGLARLGHVAVPPLCAPCPIPTQQAEVHAA